MNAADLVHNSNRIIIKIGSAILTENGTVRRDWLETLAADIAELQKQGKDVLVVSSGAIALGRTSLGISLDKASRELKIAQKQAAAAIGQMTLIQSYIDCFGAAALKVAQILLSPADTEDRRAHLNARATLLTLVEEGFVPIINENDTTATDEIRFGDNDRLAARVAQMIEADLLLILSTADGLYTDNPAINPEAQHIPLVENINEDYLSVATDTHTGVSTGGMKSKLLSARIAVNAGTNVIVTGGMPDHPVKSLGTRTATVFPAAGTPESARKRWIKAHLNPAGFVRIDTGAVTALQNGKSLLPVGVTDIHGEFARGDAVHVQNENGDILAIGLSGYDSGDARRIKGQNSDNISDILGYAGRDALIHRNDMVLL